MKKIILFVLILLSSNLFAQDYDKSWTKVIGHENNGKIKSGNQEVEKIYKKASSSKNEVQIIKCFFYESKYLQTLEEDSQYKIILNLEREISKASIPSKAILNFVYAKCLQSFLNKNSAKLHQRTKLNDSEFGNFATWTISDFNLKIDELFAESTKEEAILKATSLKKYEAIFDFLSLEKLENANLYDYLILENIEYQKSKIHQWSHFDSNSKENYKSLLGNNDEFINQKIDSIKMPTLKYIIHLYKKISQKENSEIELERLKFCNEFIVKDNIEYFKRIVSLQKRTKDIYILQKIQFEKANFYDSRASKEEYPEYKLKAISCLDSIISVPNKSNTYKKALFKRHQISYKNIHIKLQSFCYENESTRAFITYRNIDSFKISFYKTTKEFINSKKVNDSLIRDFIAKNKVYTSQNYKLKNNPDYFDYTTEVILPQLELGLYIAIIDIEEDETLKEKLTFQTINVSNSSVLGIKKGTKSIYQILNRKTGKPIENCSVISTDFDLKSNKDGIVEFDESSTKPNSDYNRNLVVINKNDTLFSSSSYINAEYDHINSQTEKVNAKVNFYLDRAIYRPGQTVYYKGIAVEKKNFENSCISNFLLNITINDANDDEIKTFEVTTNAFGSFSGSFVIPRNGITGLFKIEATEPEDYEKDALYDIKEDFHPIWDEGNFEHSEITFSVEEYKRPKFEVKFEPIKETYIFNQDVEVKGTAMAFAGSSISGAEVSYTVELNYHHNTNRNHNDGETLLSSKTKTDSKGNFQINFKATQPDDNKTIQSLITSYTINATVTDVNGETRSAQTTLNIGNQALILDAKISKEITSNKIESVYLNSTNLNRQFTPTGGELKIYYIKKFDNKFKKRTFGFPEIESISNEDFDKLFPYEQNEIKLDENEKGTLVYSKKVNTLTDKFILLDFIKNYKSGFYKITFSATDKFNNLVETNSFFQFHQVNDKQSIGNELFYIRQLNENPKKDGFLNIEINTSLPDVYISCKGIFNSLIFYENDVTILNNTIKMKIPIGKAIKDIFKIGVEAYYENQYFLVQKTFFIKEETQKLKIEIESFRDKLQPGQPENWSFKIKDKNHHIDSEVLASMYDSSLDQFEQANWEELISRSYISDYFRGKTNLGNRISEISRDNYSIKLNRFELQNETNKLIWFGFDFNNSKNAAVSREYRKQITKKAKKPINSQFVKGVVSDSSGPLPGANVLVKGTTRGVSTDIDGNFEIEVALGEVLIFSFIGLKDDSLIIENLSNSINIILNPESNRLDEVLVVGAMGIRKKKEAQTSSTQKITFAEELAQASNPNIAQSLSGRVSGLQINTTNNGVNPTTRIVLRGNRSLTGDKEVLIIIDGEISTSEALIMLPSEDVIDISILKEAQGTTLYGVKGANGVVIVTTKKGVQELNQVKTRTNRNETAFFFPHLRTDKDGKINFQFTSPEELTQWKLRLFAHNKKASIGYLEKSVITQKDLMIVPNMPRFLRENDTISIVAKVSNLTTSAKNGMAILQLFDATTMENIDVKTTNTNAVKNFTINPSGNTVVKWNITIPKGLQGIQYKVIAKAGDFSDGEESVLPVLTNNILVIESIPVWVRENTKKEYTFDNLKNTTSSTLQNHQFTFEYTSNPNWLAIQSLPYLMEYEHDCAEQTFSRYYANVLATEIINSNPKIASVFENWKNSGAPSSKLEQNEELKSLILAETPWLKDTQNEEEKRKNLALLFDLETMKNSQEITFKKLTEKQKSSGGFPWFDGGNESEYITRHIVAGLGHLEKLKVNEDLIDSFEEITKTAIPYLDSKFIDANKDLEKASTINLYSDLHYLYTRSFYLKNYPISDKTKAIINRQLENINSNWNQYSLYNKGLASLILHRFDKKESAKTIIESLKETASTNEDWGMYWIENKAGWYWYQAPIETQALLIEAFSEITNDTKSIDAMKVWLLKNKQTKNWPTTKSTTEAIYALLMQGSNWLSVKDNTIIKIGDDKIMTKKLSKNDKEAETGYIKMTWKADEVKKEMATITVENKSKVPGYGGIYWQYFEDLDKIKSNTGAVLSTAKELYLKKSTSKGDELVRINSKNPLKIGNLVTIRIIITAKEDMEYVHLKDMRASCFEPINVLSEYKWDDGLSYYMSTKDAATHFFFDKINKGTYVIEYDIRVNNSGNFSNGITTIQSMYAPEFTSHTKGIRIETRE